MAFLAGEALVTVLPNATGFSALLSKQVTPAVGKLESGLKGTVQRIAGNVTGLGTSIGTTLGLGLAVAGVAAGKMALDFENAFTQIAALSNSSAADIERWKGQVLDLAGETARAPQELADALYFLASAGLKTGEVMGALTVSAQAAAVGLGSTTDIAKIVAQAMNAYADAGLTAVEVTDTLVAAVKVGIAAPEEFATALGRVLPIADATGVSFENLVASLAVMSKAGLDVNEGVTAMRGALQAIAAPGSQAAQAMDDLGISAQELLDAISSDGLLGAFRLLDEAALQQGPRGTAVYNDALRKIIPNVRALTGVMNITGQAAKGLDADFEQVTNHTGELSSALEKWQQGPGASFARLITQMKVAAIQFGEAILPVAQTLARLLIPVLSAAAGSAGKLLVAFLAYKTLTFLPTLLLATASAMETVGLASASSAVAGVSLMSTSLASIAGPAALATAGIVGLGLALAHFTGHDEQTFDVLGDSLAKLAPKVRLTNDEFLGLAPVMQSAFGPTKLLSGTIGELTSKTDSAVPSVDALAGATDKLATAHEKDAQSAIDALNAELALAGNLTGILGSLESAASATDDLAAARRKLDHLTAAGKQGSQAYRQAVDDVKAAELGALNAQLNLADAVESYKSAVGDQQAQKEAIAQIKTFGAQAGLTKGQIADMLDTLRDTIRDYNTLAKAPNIEKKVTVTGDASQAISEISRLLAAMNSVGLSTSSGLLQLLAHEQAAMGFHGEVNRPTLFLTGEAGSERVDITPRGQQPPAQPVQTVQSNGPGRISGQLAITDWHRGVAVIDAEISNIDRTSGR